MTLDLPVIKSLFLKVFVNRYETSTTHIHYHPQKPINEEKRRASRKRLKQNAKRARSRLRKRPRSEQLRVTCVYIRRMANGVLKIATLDYRGLNRQLERRAIVKSMSTNDIICLQETYITENKSAEWEREWGGEFFYSAYTNKSADQIILINNNFKYDILKSFFSYGPRIIGIELEIDKEQYTVVNCYGPANRQD